MKSDPLKRFENLSQQAQHEPPPSADVADAVMRTIAASSNIHRTNRTTEALRDQCWFATTAACVAVVICWFAWPSWESPFETYALLWSPLAGMLP